MFKFGFSTYNDEENEEDRDKLQNSSNLKWDESKEIVHEESNNLIKCILKDCKVQNIDIKDNNLKYLCCDEVVNILKKQGNLENDSILKAEQNHSDLVSTVYEGGLKIWECTYDLLNFLTDTKITLKNKKVLDLGCGAGILGIFSILNGSRCYFQDYNAEVIKYITIPNVLLNSVDNRILKSCKFYSGDWGSFTELLTSDFLKEDDKFDYIFTSETIYNPVNYEKLCGIFKKSIKKDGIIYLAAKSFYFGVGGGTSSFQDFLKTLNTFQCRSSWNCTQGLRREILQIKLK